MRILIVEDDERIAKPLAEDLKHQYHIVDIARDGIDGLSQATTIPYDMILLDVMLPLMDGINLCKCLRSSGYKTLILMLTARDTTTDKVIGLDAGADDYLVKPFDLEELSARIRALSRRKESHQLPILTYGNLRFDPSTRMVTYNDEILSLTPKEYMILEVFLRNPNRVFTRSYLLEKLWEIDKESGEETVKTHLTNLRRKLKAVGLEPEIIETVYGVGYRLCIFA